MRKSKAYNANRKEKNLIEIHFIRQFTTRNFWSISKFSITYGFYIQILFTNFTYGKFVGNYIRIL